MNTEMVYQNPHASAPLRYGLDVVCNTEDDVILSNCLTNANKVKQWVKWEEPHDKTLLICGSGPSIRDDVEVIREMQENGAHVWALNNCANFLASVDILADAQVIMDAQEHNLKAIGPAKKHLFASQCHPDMFVAVPDAILWHSTHGDMKVDEQPGFPDHDGDYCLIGSAVSVGNTAMVLAYAMGYRRIHLFGYDSSNKGSSHVIHQAWNDGEPMTIVEFMGKKYVSSLTMSLQAEAFPSRAEVLIREGADITVHGYGLLPYRWNAFIRSEKYETWKPASGQVTVCTVNAGNYLGRGAEYANILFDSVRRNMSQEFKFVVFTDCPDGYLEGIEVRPLPVSGLRGWWNKLPLFKSNTFSKGERVLFMDLDTVITGSLANVCSFSNGFYILRDYYRPNGLQSSVMAWTAGDMDYVWESWAQAGKPEIDGGDQAWIERVVKDFYLWQGLFDDFESYKMLESSPADKSVIVFHGLPRPHHVFMGWVPNVWKVGGSNQWLEKMSHHQISVTPAFVRACAVLDRIHHIKNPVGAEIGVFAAQMSVELLKRKDLSLYMIDAWLGGGESYDGDSGDFHASLSQEEQDDYQKLAINRTEFAVGRRFIIKSLSETASKAFPDGFLDFVFIDADHGYEGCKKDLYAWWPKVKSGGLFSGHDYENSDFEKFGVKRAVDEFAAEHDVTVELGDNFTWFITHP